MKTAIVPIYGLNAYSQSRPHNTPKLKDELPDAWEERTWRERVHRDRDGFIFIPPMSFKFAIADAAAFRSEKIKGKGNNTWTKHFSAGIIVADACPIYQGKERMHADKARGEWVYCHSDGKRTSGTRVYRQFPMIDDWSTTCAFHIVDDIITEEIFLKFLRQAGQFIGIGRFRPRNGGILGRFAFDASKVKWTEDDL